MFKQIVLFIVTAILIIGCGTSEDLGTSKVNVTENPATEVPLPPAFSSGDECGNAYYPIVDGAQWNYTGSNGSIHPSSYCRDRRRVHDRGRIRGGYFHTSRSLHGGRGYQPVAGSRYLAQLFRRERQFYHDHDQQ